LLRFVLDDLADFAGIDRRQFDEFGENMKTGRANIDVFGFDPALGDDALQGGQNDFFPGRFLGSIRPQRLDDEIFET
jgi:hypothetical protein